MSGEWERTEVVYQVMKWERAGKVEEIKGKTTKGTVDMETESGP